MISNNMVFNKCKLRRACAPPFQAKKLKMMFGQKLNTGNIQVTSKGSDQTARMLLAHTTLLEISCRGSFVLDAQKNNSFECTQHRFLLKKETKILLTCLENNTPSLY